MLANLTHDIQAKRGMTFSQKPSRAPKAVWAVHHGSSLRNNPWFSKTGLRLLLIIAITVFNAACFIAIKAGLPYAPPLRFASLRLLIAGLALFSLLPLLHQPLWPPRRFWPWLLVLALGPTTLAYGTMFLSPGLAGAGIASVLGNLQPLVIVGLAAMLLGEKMTSDKWFALGFGLGGILFIAYPALSAPDAFGFTGAVLALISAVSLALGSVLIKWLGPQTPLLTLSAWQLILGGLPLVLASGLLEQGSTISWNVSFIGLLLFLALAATAFITATWYLLLQHSDVGRLSMVFFLVPVLGLGLAAVIFGETVSLLEALGVMLILIAMVAVARESWLSGSWRKQAVPVPGASVCWCCETTSTPNILRA